MGWNDLKVDFDRNFNRTGMGWNELEWVRMTWNGCNDIKADFDRDFNRIGMGWNEIAIESHYNSF